MGIRQEIGRFLKQDQVTPPSLPGPDIRVPSAAELREAAEQRRHVAHGETLSPTVAFVLSWQNSNGEPEEEVIPAWGSPNKNIPGKFYYRAELPTWVAPRLQRVMLPRLDNLVTVTYDDANEDLHVRAIRKGSEREIDQVFRVNHKRLFERIGIQLSVRRSLPPQRVRTD